MTPKERILSMLQGERPDRVPLLGGFVVAAKHYCEITGASQEEFDGDPQGTALRAYRALDVDGLILLRLPPGKEGHFTYRSLTTAEFHAHEERFRGPEDILAWVEKLPSPRERLASFDAEAWKAKFVSDARRMQRLLGDIVWLPTQWDVVHPTFEWYNCFGYETYMLFLGLYPEAADRLFGWEVQVKRRISMALVEAYRELDLPPLVHIGSDICGKNGPVVSARRLREFYFPHVRACLEPLVEAGFALVWHADGVVMPIVDDLLACGVSGFQGFQWEYGMRMEDLTAKRTLRGEPLTIFAGPSTSSTLPFGTIADVRREVDHVVDAGLDNCRLFFLPGNDVLPDTPTESLVEAYRHAARRSRK